MISNRLSNQKFAFDGPFENEFFEEISTMLLKLSGAIVLEEFASDLNYLISALGTQSKVKTANENGASIEELTPATLDKVLRPSASELVDSIKAGDGSLGEFLGEYARYIRLFKVNRLDLKKQDLRGVQIESASFLEVDIDGCNFAHAHLRFCRFPYCKSVDFSGSDIVSGYIGSAQSCNFSSAKLSKCSFERAELIDCNFEGAALDGVTYRLTSTTKSNFRGADLRACSLNESSFRELCLDGADMSDGSFEGCDFTKASFKDANLQRSALTDATFEEADLTGANLRDSLLADANLCSATIDGADFTGCTLNNTKIKGLKIEKAIGLVQAIEEGVNPSVGPNIEELEKLVVKCENFESTLSLDVPGKGPVQLTVAKDLYGLMSNIAVAGHVSGTDKGSLSQRMLSICKRFTRGTPNLRKIKTSIDGHKLDQPKLDNLIIAAWSEALGKPVLTRDELESQAPELHTLREHLVKLLKEGDIAAFNTFEGKKKEAAEHLSGFDLANSDLTDVDFTIYVRIPEEEIRRRQMRNSNFKESELIRMGSFNLDGTNFNSAVLKRAKLDECSIVKSTFLKADLNNANLGAVYAADARFDGASLNNANISCSNLTNASFAGADLIGANLSYSILSGVDFSDAILDNVKCDFVEYDTNTKWPKGYSPPPSTKRQQHRH